MRRELLFNPRLLFRRIYELSESYWRGRAVAGSNLRHGDLDSLELLQLADVRRLETVYDVGANTGKWTALAKTLAPNVRVEAFEPSYDLRPKFVAETARWSGIALHSVALGASNREMRLNIASDTASSSLLEMTPLQRSAYRTTTLRSDIAKVVRLDDYAHTQKLPQADLVKMDVQGYELEVVKGAIACISRAEFVIAEVSFYEFYKGQCLFHQLASELWTLGLAIYAFGRSTPVGLPVMQTDVLFKRVH